MGPHKRGRTDLSRHLMSGRGENWLRPPDSTVDELWRARKNGDMPRQPRYFVPGIPQHVITRGIDRQAVFFCQDDYALYRRALLKSSTEYDCEIHAYVLMLNHIHLLVTPLSERALPQMMQGMGREYVQRLNARHARTGTLWEGRYKACLVQTDEYFLTCQRYIELNPVRAGIVDCPGKFPYSSYACNALGADDPLISQHPCYRALQSGPVARRRSYRSLFAGELSEEDLRMIRVRTNACSFVGGERFRRQIEGVLGRSLTTGQRGRPRGKVP
jgi:putative transposase